MQSRPNSEEYISFRQLVKKLEEKEETALTIPTDQLFAAAGLSYPVSDDQLDTFFNTEFLKILEEYNELGKETEPAVELAQELIARFNRMPFVYNQPTEAETAAHNKEVELNEKLHIRRDELVSKAKMKLERMLEEYRSRFPEEQRDSARIVADWNHLPDVQLGKSLIEELEGRDLVKSFRQTSYGFFRNKPARDTLEKLEVYEAAFAFTYVM